MKKRKQKALKYLGLSIVCFGLHACSIFLEPFAVNSENKVAAGGYILGVLFWLEQFFLEFAGKSFPKRLVIRSGNKRKLLVCLDSSEHRRHGSWIRFCWYPSPLLSWEI